MGNKEKHICSHCGETIEADSAGGLQIAIENHFDDIHPEAEYEPREDRDADGY
jgi:hypothetical protein